MSRSIRSTPPNFAPSPAGAPRPVLAGIDAAQAAGLKIKINTVALKGVNDDEFPRLIEWAHGRGMELTLIEVMPLGEIGEASRLDQYLPLSLVRAELARALSARRSRLPHRRTGTLCTRRRDRRPARLHHAADPQFLRKLQSRARHLHRHALYVSRQGRRRRPAHAAARLGSRRSALAAIDEAIARKPKGHDFIIDRRHRQPALARHMSVTGG